MSVPSDALVAHLSRVFALDPRAARRVVEEVAAFSAETTEELVRRRHRELQRSGLGNDAIFARIGEELDTARVRPGPLTARQLRRIIYG